MNYKCKDHEKSGMQESEVTQIHYRRNQNGLKVEKYTEWKKLGILVRDLCFSHARRQINLK